MKQAPSGERSVADQREVPRRVAVIDIGKTNCKVVLVADGVESWSRTVPNIVRQDGPYPHFDTEAIERFLLDALADLNRDHGFDAVSITAHGGSGVLLQGDELALPVLDYEYDGPDRLSEEYDRVRPPYGESFSPRLPGGLNVGAQLFWQEREFPEDFADATFATYPQYWACRLTGVAATEPTSLGSHTDLWAPGARRYSTMVDRLGWRSKMAPLRSAFDTLGPVKPDLARSLGLVAPVPVCCGIHDSNASIVPYLGPGAGELAVVSTGTWVVLFAIGGALDRLEAGRDMLANVDAYGRPVPSARFMGGREFDILTGRKPATPDGAAVASVIERDVMALPTFSSGNGPFPAQAGRWSHDPVTLTPAEVTAAASLYVALVTATSLSLLEARGPVVVEGPFARNDLYCDALQALVGREVRAAGGGTGTSVGAALLLGGTRTTPPSRARPAALLPPGPDFARYAAQWRERCRGN